MHSVHIIGINEFRSLGTRWNRLAETMAYPMPFFTWEWMHTWWETFGGDPKELMILAVSEGNDLQAILPLYRDQAFLQQYWLSGSVLTYCGSREMGSDHMDILASPQDTAQGLEAVFAYLSSEFKNWDVLRIPRMASGGSALTWFNGWQNGPFKHLSLELAPASVAPFIRLEGNFDDFMKRFDKKQRYNIRSRQKKLYEQHGFEYVNCDSNPAEFLRCLFDLHRRRATQKRIKSTFDADRVYKFHEAFCRQAIDKNWVQLRAIRRGGETIAASYNLEFGNRVFSYQKGFDPEWNQFGPGVVLMYELIREAYDNGREEYNLLQGNEAYKQMWTSETRQLVTGHVYNSTALGNLSRRSYRWKGALKSLLRRKAPLPL